MPKKPKLISEKKLYLHELHNYDLYLLEAIAKDKGIPIEPRWLMFQSLFKTITHQDIKNKEEEFKADLGF